MANIMLHHTSLLLHKIKLQTNSNCWKTKNIGGKRALTLSLIPSYSYANKR